MAGRFQERLGINELTDKNSLLWKALLAELVGSILLNFFGCASVVNVDDPKHPPNLVLIALSFGLTIFAVVHTLGHISGGHINPAVTLSMLVTGNVPIIRGLLYIVAQCIGALAGSGILKALTPDEVQESLGLTALNGKVSAVQGLGMEFLLGFVLVLVIFGVCDANRPEAKFTGPFAIGMTVALGHLAAVDYTGSSMNPSRSFGSAVIAGEWQDHWVYWVGPCLGGVCAALLYTAAFTAPQSASLNFSERYSAVNMDDKDIQLKHIDDNGGKHDV